MSMYGQRLGSIGLFIAFAGATPGALAQSPALQHAASLYADGKGVALKAPEGVLCGAGDDLIVADTGNGRLVRFTYRQNAATAGTEIRHPLVSSPVRLQWDASRAVVVLDRRTRQLVRLDPNGADAKAMKLTGVPAPAAVVPGAFRIDANGRYFVLDLGTPRIVVTGADGQFVRQLALPADGRAFTDLYVAKTGALYAVDAVAARVYVSEDAVKPLHPFGAPMKDVASFPEYITGGEQGALLLVDNHGSGIVAIGPDGTYRGRQLRMGWIDGLVYYPGQICGTTGGAMVVADRGNNRVQIFRSEL